MRTNKIDANGYLVDAPESVKQEWIQDVLTHTSIVKFQLVILHLNITLPSAIDSGSSEGPVTVSEPNELSSSAGATPPTTTSTTTTTTSFTSSSSASESPLFENKQFLMDIILKYTDRIFAADNYIRTQGILQTYLPELWEALVVKRGQWIAETMLSHLSTRAHGVDYVRPPEPAGCTHQEPKVTVSVALLPEIVMPTVVAYLEQTTYLNAVPSHQLFEEYCPYLASPLTTALPAFAAKHTPGSLPLIPSRRMAGKGLGLSYALHPSYRITRDKTTGVLSKPVKSSDSYVLSGPASDFIFHNDPATATSIHPSGIVQIPASPYIPLPGETPVDGEWLPWYSRLYTMIQRAEILARPLLKSPRGTTVLERELTHSLTDAERATHLASATDKATLATAATNTGNGEDDDDNNNSNDKSTYEEQSQTLTPYMAKLKEEYSRYQAEHCWIYDSSLIGKSYKDKMR